MRIIDVQLNKDRLLAISDKERTLFLAFGHVANELNALTKMLYWSGSAPIRNDAEARGQNTISLFLIRLLAGKLNESWELVRTNFFGNALSRTYAPKLDDKGLKALESLKQYFSKNNVVHEIRNNFAFHYSPAETAAVLSDVDEELHVYMQKDIVPNNLFAFSEAVLAKALLVLLKKMGMSNSLEDLLGELLEIAARFAELIDSIMFAIINQHGKELRMGSPQDVHFDQLQDFQSVTLPWFTDTSKINEVSKDSD